MLLCRTCGRMIANVNPCKVSYAYCHKCPLPLDKLKKIDEWKKDRNVSDFRNVRQEEKGYTD